ncbi:hypothetical protein F5B18DRAFT_358147 [Nemania serpens]|nr:hypothetical protein F5B18DRAFT_358147 [Nemania serpens]
MFVLPPYIQDLTATQPFGALSKAIANKRLDSNDGSYMDLFKTLRKSTEHPYPPRPPTPGPPQPYPPIPPRPYPGPTPPPSPHHLLFSGLSPQLSILVSSAEPFQCPYPSPPPSPVPPRPGPMFPRPNVPTPPPSPRRSISPLISSDARDLIVLLLEYLCFATWNTGTAYGYVSMAAGDAMCLKWHGDNLYAKPPIVMPELPKLISASQ